MKATPLVLGSQSQAQAQAHRDLGDAFKAGSE